MTNIIEAAFSGGTISRTKQAYQYDYGQILKFTGLELPQAYEVHFANSEKGNSVTQIGDSYGVAIPDSMFQSGAFIYAWVFLHAGNSDGETEYKVTIPIIKRARPTNATPTPVQQDAITEAIAALNAAVTQTAADAAAAAASAQEIEDMTVSAETLPIGSEASVEKSIVDDVVHLSFGLPRGEQGEQGETGPTGATPSLSIGTVDTLPAGSDATASFTGTDEEPVLNLGIPVGQSGDANNIAADYSSKPYSVGEYCIYAGSLYRCTTAITTAEAWTAAHWTAVPLGKDVFTLMASLAPTYSAQEVYPKGAYRWHSGTLYKSNVAITTPEAFASSKWDAVPLGDDAGIAIGQVIGTEICPFSTSGHIQLRGAGNTQGTTPATSANYTCIVLPVKKGESITVWMTPDKTAASYKGYVFTDNAYTVVERISVGVDLFGVEFIAPSDGYFIANAEAARKPFLVRNGLSAMKAINALSTSVADVYNINGAKETLSATIESGKAYRASDPYGVNLSGFTTYNYKVDGLDTLLISINQIPTADSYKLAMWYDESGNYIGYTSRVGSSLNQSNVPVSVPIRAATLRISAGSAQSVSVLKLVMPSRSKKYVSLSGDVITIANDKYTYVMSKHGNNNLMDLYRVLAKDGTVLQTFSTDWQGPYQVAAVNNADGDAIAQGQTYTGGNHAYAFDGSSGSATARTSAIKVYADGVELTDGQTLPWADCVSVEWTNFVQGWNTKKSDGTGREILTESPAWRFLPNDRIETENRIEALEDITIGLYYGLQMAAAWLGGGVLLPSAKRSIIQMSEFTSQGIGTRFAGYNVTALGNDISITMGYDPFVDLGEGTGISNSEIKQTRIHTSTGKCYIYMAYGFTLDDDEIMSYAGYYQFR